MLPSCGSCPDPALADHDMRVADPLSLSNGHHPGAPPAAAPHPDVYLVEPAAVVPVPLRVGGGAAKKPIVLEAVWNSWVTVASNETQNEHVRDRADVEAGQARVAGQVIEQGTPACCMILSKVRSMGSNVLKYMRDTSLWAVQYPGPMAHVGHKVQLKKI